MTGVDQGTRQPGEPIYAEEPIYVERWGAGRRSWYLRTQTSRTMRPIPPYGLDATRSAGAGRTRPRTRHKPVPGGKLPHASSGIADDVVDLFRYVTVCWCSYFHNLGGILTQDLRRNLTVGCWVIRFRALSNCVNSWMVPVPNTYDAWKFCNCSPWSWGGVRRAQC